MSIFKLDIFVLLYLIRKVLGKYYCAGFSFPQTDLAVKYLFQSALRNSEPDIYVVNRAKEDELRSVYQYVLQGQCVNYEYIGSDNVVEQFISKFFLTDSFQWKKARFEQSLAHKIHLGADFGVCLTGFFYLLFHFMY